MKVKIDRKPLLELIDRCLPATSSKSLVYGKSFLLTAEKNPDQLRISALGESLSIDSCQHATVDKPGRSVLDATRLRSLVEAMPEGNVALEHKKGKEDHQAGRVHVSALARHYSAQAFDAADFPNVPEVPEGIQVISVPGDALAQAIESTSFAMDAAPTHEHLNGVILQFTPGQLQGAAMRSACAAESTLACPVTAQCELFIPHTILRTTIALCGNNQKIQLSSDERRIYVETDSTLASALLPTAQRPDWRQLLDMYKQNDPICGIDGGVLSLAIQAILKVKTQACITLALTKGMLTLTLVDKEEQCSAEEPLPVRADVNASFTVSVDAQNLVAALKPCAVAQLYVGKQNDPLTVRAQDRTFFAALAPMIP